MPSTAITTIYYVSRKFVGRVAAAEAVDVCISAFEIVPISRATIDAARALGGADFEDDLQIAAAIEFGADWIVTRDQSGFRQSSIPAETPSQFLARLQA